jgi:hypothetical protein
MCNRKLSIVLLLSAIFFICLVADCGNGGRISRSNFLIIGTDTLTTARINIIAPDSLPMMRKTMRASLEMLLVKSKPKVTLQPDSMQVKQIAIDLAEQLYRQTSDAWTPEAASYLYNAVKVVMAWKNVSKAFVHIDSIVSVSTAINDSTLKKELLEHIRFLIKGSNRTPNRTMSEQTAAGLFFLDPDVAHIVCEFAATAEMSAKNVSDKPVTVKGLVCNKNPAVTQKTSSHKIAQVKTASATVINDNAKDALKYRNQKSIKDSIQKHLPDLEAMYKKYLKMHTDMTGTIWVTFNIKADGSIASAQIKTSQITEKDFFYPFHEYITKNIHFLPVPEKTGIMTVEFPFEFTPEN